MKSPSCLSLNRQDSNTNISLDIYKNGVIPIIFHNVGPKRENYERKSKKNDCDSHFCFVDESDMDNVVTTIHPHYLKRQ